ncbi:ferredoxin [Mycobacterium sp. EPa45]|uniref:ferredoxin n=1 Tax=Mycobacterium sp. EPa45 TaxID=1545728 RepID=UPI000641EF02|nr:ferredoxin [Mycobacterium sp. EPa45]AKK28719.1 hypothetical protein AB431_20900 [Mycobacterium sp. EPa45]
MTEHVTVHVNPSLCEGHGTCTELSPRAFNLGDEDVATVTRSTPTNSTGATFVPPPQHVPVKPSR